MEKEQIIKKLRENKEVLEGTFYISRIGLFGSYPSDTSHENGDVDLLYELKGGKRLGFIEVSTLERFIKC